MQSLDNNVSPTQKDDDQTQPLISSEPSKEVDAERAGGAKTTENDGPSQSTAPAGPISSTTSSNIAYESNITPNHPATTTSSSAAHHAPPAAKRFSSATISKQFLNKATSGGGKADGVSQHQKSAPSGSALSGNQRPTQPTPAAHSSRLVTARLTTIGPTSANSTGWNTPRTNSATNTANPSPVQTPGLSAANKQLPLSAATTNQPPERSNSNVKGGAPGKPWGDVKKVAVAPPAVSAANDFPTAAEVARGKAQATKPPKQIPPQLATDSSLKALSNESADAFRGLHLDPKSQHWDEDEEDNDNYLGEVVEFGDGARYSVPPTATTETHPTASVPDATLPTEAKENASMRKEDRFTDDFDRSWPKGRNSSLGVHSPRSYPREPPSPAHTHSTLHSEHGDNRVLFNERSNRMEPAHSAWGRRENDGPNGRRPPPSNRERPSFPGRDRWSSGGEPTFQGPQGRPPRGDRNSNYGGHLRTDMPPPPPPGSQPEGSAWNRSSYRRPSNASQDDSPRMMSGPGFRNRQSGHDVDREFHRSRLPSGAPSRLEPPSPRTPRLPEQRSFDRPPPFGSSGRRDSEVSRGYRSPLLETRSITAEPLSPGAESTQSMALPQGDQLDPATKAEKLNALTKSELHSGAQRARERRLKEEEERQKQQDRAKAKAAAIAAQLEEETKAAEEEKQRLEEERKAKEEAERIEREKAAAERAKAAATSSEIKPPPATRRKLELLPRTKPPPELTVVTPKETKATGSITLLPDAVVNPFSHLEKSDDEHIEVFDYEDMGHAIKGSSLQLRPEADPSSNTSIDVAEGLEKEIRRDAIPARKASVPNSAGATTRPPTNRPSPSDNPPASVFVPTSPSRRPQPVVPPSPSFSSTRHTSLTSPVTSRYREAPLASVSETMSRLKSVLNSITVEHRHDDFSVSITPPEAVTIVPAEPSVKIPSSRVGQSSAPAKGLGPRYQKDKALQIMSFEPPIANLSQATLSRDETLLEGMKSTRAHVKLPNGRDPTAQALPSRSSTAPRGPPTAAPRAGFGRGNRADEDNWRKPKEPKPQSEPSAVKEVEVLSRSPHPIQTDISGPATVHVPVKGSGKAEPVSSPTTSSKGSKGKVPTGIDVSFYRSPSKEAQPVLFTVSSEIEPSVDPAKNDLTLRTSGESTNEEKKPDETSGSTLLTPPPVPSATAWEKSPLGFPVTPLNGQVGPDSIKAVWDSATPGTATATENSLRGIVDDLPPAIPMSVQELKSDDSEPKVNPGAAVAVISAVTQQPPAPKRSLQDAHRAFQIVPASPASAGKPPAYTVTPPTITPQRPTDPNPSMLPPSPYMMPGQPPFAASNGYGPRPPYVHPTPPTPNMMWGQPPTQFMPNGSLSVRQQTPGGTGPSPPLPQQIWMGQPQSQQVPQTQHPPPFHGNPQFNYGQG
ncbi:hypothetical protein FRB90_010096, partial [Tulasnella sp. 427]